MRWIPRLAALALGAALTYRWQKNRQAQAVMGQGVRHALDFVKEPGLVVQAGRRQSNQLELSWSSPAERVDIAVSTRPDDFAGARITQVQGEQSVLLSDLPDERCYFRLTFGDGQTITTAERYLPLPSVPNIRDIGGYATEDGRFVRWNRVYRSGGLDSISDADLAKLFELDLQLICDLRSVEEVEEYPDRLPEEGEAVYMHLPPKAETRVSRQVSAVLRHRNDLGGLLREIYTGVMIDQNARIFGTVLRKLARPDLLPALIHCAAGKDRTGIAIALLLRVLGVSEELVVADYTLSNHAHEQIVKLSHGGLVQLRRLGLSDAAVQPLLLADAAIIRAALAHVDARYGGVQRYLIDAAGLDEHVLEALRNNFLSEDSL